jgi:1-acyl-sn-glycerol-3-phosphate acyltransferase
MTEPSKRSKENRYSVPLTNRLLRPPLKTAFFLLLKALSPVTVTGREHVPARGPYLVAINHVSLYEAPLILAFWPSFLEVLGAAEIWHKPFQNVLARMYYALPVHRGQYDRQVLEKAVVVLESGRPLLIAPEGGRSHTPGMRRAHPGVAFLAERAAQRTGAPIPIIPVALVGTTEDYAARAFAFKRPALEMHIGAPLTFPPLARQADKKRSDALQANADQVMLAIAAMLPPEYHGVYAASELSN